MKKPEILSRVREAVEAQLDQAKVTSERVISELGLLAFADMRDFLRLSPDGSVLGIDLKDTPEGATRAIGEIQIKEYVEGHGDDAKTVRLTKFKLQNKLGALDTLAKYLGLLVDRTEVDAEVRHVKEVRIVDERGRESPLPKALLHGADDAAAPGGERG